MCKGRSNICRVLDSSRRRSLENFMLIGRKYSCCSFLLPAGSGAVRQTKNSYVPIGNRIHVLPAWNALPQPTATPRVHFYVHLFTIFLIWYLSTILYRGAEKTLTRPGSKQANISLKISWISFGALPCRKNKILITSRVSMLLKSRASLLCFQDCFLPGRAKDVSAPRYKRCLFTWLSNSEFNALAPRFNIRRCLLHIYSYFGQCDAEFCRTDCTEYLRGFVKNGAVQAILSQRT